MVHRQPPSVTRNCRVDHEQPHPFERHDVGTLGAAFHPAQRRAVAQVIAGADRRLHQRQVKYPGWESYARIHPWLHVETGLRQLRVHAHLVLCISITCDIERQGVHVLHGKVCICAELP